MKSKMIFFDIDGTLLDDSKQVLPSTKAAIRELEANGHQVVIATGRNLSMARIVIEELELKHYIVCNGAAGYFDHEMIYENPLDRYELDRLIQLADKNGHGLAYETPEKVRRRTEEAGARMESAMREVGFGVPEYDRDFYQHHSLVQALLFYREEEKGDYENGQFSKFRFVRWNENGVDVLPHDGSKANTVMHFAKKKGFNREDTIAFGDGMNDEEMLTKVGTGVAMGNALESIKLRADRTTASNNEDGIALALKELELIS
ncbi:Cof-type HAD-IIB family hydrolase [Pisciglobus halotolerans]|nr:Cof-type HAD-IIB family hydrolase [Pisciglobus halotolerans]